MILKKCNKSKCKIGKKNDFHNKYYDKVGYKKRIFYFVGSLKFHVSFFLIRTTFSITIFAILTFFKITVRLFSLEKKVNGIIRVAETTLRFFNNGDDLNITHFLINKTHPFINKIKKL